MFSRYIIRSKTLAGWDIPQGNSYFSLQLPYNWWFFGLDLSLEDDIDIDQLSYFIRIYTTRINKNDSIIVGTHQPTWLLAWYNGSIEPKNLTILLNNYLKNQCIIRIAGDIHNYIRHTKIIIKNKNSITTSLSSPLHLIVSGGGGAFLHPTSPFFYTIMYNCGILYKPISCFPTVSTSLWLSFGNIIKFRKKNWRFDLVGGLLYFFLVFTVIPICNITNTLPKYTNLSTYIINLLLWWKDTIIKCIILTIKSTGISFFVLLFGYLASYSILPNFTFPKRIFISTIHVLFHLIAAFTCALILEYILEIATNVYGFGSNNIHSLYYTYTNHETLLFPDPNNVRITLERITFGFYPACIRWLMTIFDIAEYCAHMRDITCKNYSNIHNLSRLQIIFYYITFLLYYSVLSIPIFSTILGAYLCISIIFFNIHWDEGFSSLRIPHYKSFLRFCITPDGTLHCFCIAVDRVASSWVQDPRWKNSSSSSSTTTDSYKKKFPSRWMSQPADCYNPRIIDYFTAPPLSSSLSI